MPNLITCKACSICLLLDQLLSPLHAFQSMETDSPVTELAEFCCIRTKIESLEQFSNVGIPCSYYYYRTVIDAFSVHFLEFRPTAERLLTHHNPAVRATIAFPPKMDSVFELWNKNCTEIFGQILLGPKKLQKLTFKIRDTYRGSTGNQLCCCPSAWSKVDTANERLQKLPATKTKR